MNKTTIYTILTVLSGLFLGGATSEFISDALSGLDNDNNQSSYNSPSIASERAPEAIIPAIESFEERLDELAPHPKDPLKPSNILGKTDEELDSVSMIEKSQMLELIGEAVEAVPEDARHLFQLGRASLICGQDDLAFEFLTEATSKGSQAAKAYQAFYFDENLDTAIQSLDQSYSLGFEPAKAWADELRAELAAAAPVEVVPDFTQFSQSTWIEEMYRGEFEELSSNKIDAMLYLQSLHEYLETEALYLLDDRNFLGEIRSDLTAIMGVKLSTDQAYVERTTQGGLAMLWGAFSGMANTRRSGGSISQEVVAFQQGAIENAPFNLYVKAHGTQDGKKLALLHNQNPEAAEKIYRGLVSFVESF